MGKEIKRGAILRSIIFGLLMGLGAVIICVQTLKIKLLDGAEAKATIEKNFKKEEPIVARRGDILASDGRILACSVPNYRICMDPVAPNDDVFRAEIDELSRQLSNFFRDQSAAEYKRKITTARQNGRRYIVINTRRISYNEFKQVKTFALFRRGQNRGGFIVEENDERKMPFGILAARTIGKLFRENKDNLDGGMVGIEHSYNKELRGKNGVSNKTRITGKWINEEVVAPINGYDIVTTLDIDIQDVAESTLLRQLQRYNAEHGVALLMEVKTGAIRAIVNLHRSDDGTYTEDHYNYAIADRKEPGSTFKLATIMALLEDELIDVEDTINTFKGTYRIYDRTMRDSNSDHGGHGLISIREGFEASSNICFARLVEKYYKNDPQHFVDALRNLGLCDSLGIDIKGENATLIKNVSDKSWSGTTLPWMSIGYETEITPLQILTFYNAVANGGKMMRPMFVESIMQHGRVVEKKRPKVLRSSIASRKTISTVQELLKGVVEHGTAKNISGTPYKIAGKTGTAQIAHSDKGYTSGGTKDYLASFAGYFPADDPMYSCLVMVTSPQYVYYGNTVAGSVVKAIADRVYAAECRNGNIVNQPDIQYAKNMPSSKGGRAVDLKNVLDELGVPYVNAAETKSTWLSTTAQPEQIQTSTRRFVEGITPDVKGMGASDAVSLLESLGFQVKINGYGRVTSQSIPPGTTTIRGTVIQLNLTST